MLGNLNELHRPFGWQPCNQTNHNLPEPRQIEGIQQVLTKRGESDSPSLFSFRSSFSATHHNSHDTGMTPLSTNVRMSCLGRALSDSNKSINYFDFSVFSVIWGICFSLKANPNGTKNIVFWHTFGTGGSPARYQFVKSRGSPQNVLAQLVQLAQQYQTREPLFFYTPAPSTVALAISRLS
jgi:hypothetical protein